MLGRYADRFFAKQARERVVANSPNGSAQSIAFPDRELAGTGKVQRVSGHYEMPGPQNSIDSNALAGVQSSGMMPGMNGITPVLPGMSGITPVLPGMSGITPVLPGMSDFDAGKAIKWGLVAGVSIIGYRMWANRKARKLRARRSARRRAAGRSVRA